MSSVRTATVQLPRCSVVPGAIRNLCDGMSRSSSRDGPSLADCWMKHDGRALSTQLPWPMNDGDGVVTKPGVAGCPLPAGECSLVSARSVQLLVAIRWANTMLPITQTMTVAIA